MFFGTGTKGSISGVFQSWFLSQASFSFCFTEKHWGVPHPCKKINRNRGSCRVGRPTVPGSARKGPRPGNPSVPQSPPAVAQAWQGNLHSWLKGHACPPEASMSPRVFLLRTGSWGSCQIPPALGAKPRSASNLPVDRGYGNLEWLHTFEPWQGAAPLVFGTTLLLSYVWRSAGTYLIQQALGLVGWHPGVPCLGLMTGHTVILFSLGHTPARWSVLLISVPGGW